MGTRAPSVRRDSPSPPGGCPTGGRLTRSPAVGWAPLHIPPTSEDPVSLHPAVTEVTERIVARSADTRDAYLERIRAAAATGPAREHLGCANLAHCFAACGADEKL